MYTQPRQDTETPTLSLRQIEDQINVIMQDWNERGDEYHATEFEKRMVHLLEEMKRKMIRMRGV